MIKLDDEIFQFLSQTKNSTENFFSHQYFSEGNRNNSLTKVAGYLRSLGLDFNPLNQSLQALNQILCEEPLQEDEVDKIAASIARYPNSIFSLDDYDLLTKKEIAKLLSCDFDEPRMDFEKLPKPFLAFLDWARESTHGPDECIVLGFLAGIAGCMGKEITLQVGGMLIRPSVWIACLTSSGRGKTSALNIAKEIIMDLDEIPREERRLAEKEYLEKMDKYEKLQKKKDIDQINFKDEPQVPGIRALTLPEITSIQKLYMTMSLHYPAGVIYIASELAVMLSQWKLDRNEGMGHFFMSIFDNPRNPPELSFKNTTMLPMFHYPTVSIIGASTQGSFFERFDRDDYVSGMLQRWLIGSVSSIKPKMAIPKKRDEKLYGKFKEVFSFVFNFQDEYTGGGH